MGVKDFTELDVYKMVFKAAMEIFELSKSFPPEERYALTGQIRRSSRSVCMNIAEAWRKRRYPAAFVSKISDSEAEAAETQVSLDFAKACKYIDSETHKQLRQAYDFILGKLSNMAFYPEKWTLKIQP
ncbi:MAG: four helix bundle protein [bacterium]